MTATLKLVLPCALAALFFLGGTAQAGQATALKQAAPAAKAALPFVEDDYARALADAKSRKVPLFVEVWAPW